MKYLFISLLFSSLCYQTASAELYKWVDAQGRTHYSDKAADKQKFKKLDNANISTVKSPTANKPKQVVMYSVESCSYCRLAARWMTKNNIAFVDYDIDKNLRAREEYRKMGKKVTPVIKLGNTIITGFGKNTKKQIKEFIQ